MAKQTFKSLTDIFLADSTLYNKELDIEWFNRIKAIAEGNVVVEKIELTIDQKLETLEAQVKELMAVPITKENELKVNAVLDEAEKLQNNPDITEEQMGKINAIFIPLLLRYLFQI